jgi:hypothetical protein
LKWTKAVVAVTITTTEAKEVVADTMAMTIKRAVIEEVINLIVAKEMAIFQKVARNNIKLKIKETINPQIKPEKAADLMTIQNHPNQILTGKNLKLATLVQIEMIAVVTDLNRM